MLFNYSVLLFANKIFQIFMQIATNVLVFPPHAAVWARVRVLPCFIPLFGVLVKALEDRPDVEFFVEWAPASPFSPCFCLCED